MILHLPIEILTQLLLKIIMIDIRYFMIIYKYLYTCMYNLEHNLLRVIKLQRIRMHFFELI